MVADGTHQTAGVVLEPFPQFKRHALPGRRRDLKQLLIVALHRAVALVEGEDVAPAVRDHLNFDVMNVREVLLDEEARIAEGGLGHGGSLDEGILEFFFTRHQEDASSAAASFRLKHDRQTDFPCERSGAGNVDRVVGTRNDRNPEATRNASRFNLVAELMHGLGRGADEGDASFLAFLGECHVFARETPARVNSHAAALLRKTDHLVEIEIRPRIGA